MLCPECRHHNPDGARFCNSCGMKLDAPADDAFALPLNSDDDVPKDVESRLDGAPIHTRLVGDMFVGRQQEMGKLVAALDEAIGGQGRLVMLVGEPGIGKTRTAQELAAIAEQQGAQVLWGRCYEEQGTPPYWPWVQLIRDYVREKNPDQLLSEMGTNASYIAQIVSDLQDKLPDLNSPPPMEPEEARFHLFDSITTFLKNTARSQPLVLILEDLHWADRSSLLLLEFIAREIGQSPMLLLGTYRDIEVSRRHPLSQALGGLIREQYFRRVQLRGLCQQDVGELVELAAGISPDPGLVETVHARTEGNPLFVGEVARLLTREDLRGGHGFRFSVPEGVRDAIGRRLDRLSEDCNRVLTIVSVVGREFSLNLLGRLMDDMPDASLLGVMEEALAAGVLEEIPGSSDRYQFTHVLIQETLSDELSSARRVRMHAQIGEVLEELYDPYIEAHAAELAYHFAEGEPVLGTDKMVRYALMAGDQALASFAYDEAVAHFERGRAAREGSSTRQVMDDEMAALLYGLGRAQTAVLESHQTQEAWDNLTLAFDYYVEKGDVPRAMAVTEVPAPPGLVRGIARVLERALALVAPDSIQAGRLLSRYSFTIFLQTGDYESIQEAFNRALAIAKSQGDVALELQTLSRASLVDYYYLRYNHSLNKGLRALELATQIDNPHAKAQASYAVASSLLATGDLGGAHSYAEVMADAAERLGYRRWIAAAHTLRQLVCQVEGDWKRAFDFSERALANSPRELGHLSLRILLEHEMGDTDQGEVYLERMVERIRLNPPGPVWESTVPATVIPLVGRITGVMDRFDIAEETANTLLSSQTVILRNALVARVGLALMAAQQGDTTAAAAQYGALESLRGTMLPWSTVCADRLLGLISKTVSEFDQAQSHFQDALAFCRKAGYRPELAWSCYEYSDMLLKRQGAGDFHKATGLLDEALDITEALGMRPLMEKVVTLKEQTESRATRQAAYPDGLTRREVEVLRLIATGRTDREIADELFISTRTVSNHVSNILNKTTSTNRAEAAAYAAQHRLV